MHKLTADFLRFQDVDVFNALGAVGAYVIWAEDAKLIPTYIGHGNLFDRLSEHTFTYRAPLDGYLAITGDIGDQDAKDEACAIEGLLLWIADDTERLSEFNRQRARMDKLESHFPNHGLVKAVLSGYDPFVPPRAASSISEQKRHVRVRPNGDYLEIEHGWRRRRGAGPVA